MNTTNDSLPEPQRSAADDLDDQPLTTDPAAILASIQLEQRTLGTALMRGLPWIYLSWGVAWIVGYLALWSAWDNGNPWFTLPLALAITIFAVVIVGASAASAIIGVRLGRGVRGNSDFPDTIYGISWPLLSFAIVALGMALIQHGLSSELASLYFTSVFAIVTGAMYLFGAAIWRSPGQLVLALIMVVVGAGAAFAGNPHNLVITAVVGGGAMLLTGVIAEIRMRRVR